MASLILTVPPPDLIRLCVAAEFDVMTIPPAAETDETVVLVPAVNLTFTYAPIDNVFNVRFAQFTMTAAEAPPALNNCKLLSVCVVVS